MSAPPVDRSSLAMRLGLGVLGVLAIVYGGVRILTDAKDTKPWALARWLIGSLLVHDVLIAPVVIGLGWLLNRLVPGRVRGYLQATLICAGLVSAVGLWLIYRQGKYGARSLALLQQNYLANLVILLAIIALAGVACYTIAALRTRRTKTRSPADQ
ncbi:MAG TPA: hypothetical protein VHO01_00485 [Jatrophihabitans sp.]|nr:hypothetical protein [Jatrophihabitans sp.]